MNPLIFSIIVLLLITAMVVYLFVKGGDIKKYNLFIYLSLVIFWIPIQFFRENLGVITKNVQLLIIPILTALFQFTQVIFRIPLGILSQKIKSRKMIIMIAATTFVIFGSVMIIANFALWSIILGIIAAGITGATFGLDNQYWSENWNIKRVFFSVAIMFTVPKLSGIISNIIERNTVIHNTDLIKWLLLGLIIIQTLCLGIYALVKEDKKTIAQDLGAPHNLFKEFSIYKIIFTLGFLSVIISIVNSMIILEPISKLMIGSHRIMEEDNIKTLILLLTTGTSILVATKLVKVFSLEIIKYFSYAMITVGVIIGLSLGITKTTSLITWLVTTILISVGSAALQISLFGVILHIDHKQPLIILGIYLTMISFAKASGQLISEELFVNLPSQNHTTVLIVIFGTALTILAFSVFYLMHNHKNISKLNRIIIDYEFK